MKKSIGAKTIAFPTPLWLVGTYDEQGRPNLMSAAWGGICCSKPPSVAVSLQETRYSYHNLRQRKAFTINIPSQAHVAEADYCGLVSGRTVDKFAATGLSAVKSELVAAPYVKEFPLILECRLTHSLKIGIHTQFIGEIIDVKAEESVLNEDGVPEIEKVAPIIFGPQIRSYHGIGKYLGKAFSVGKNIR